MAEMVCSALVQETLSRGVSFALGRLEEKVSQGHLAERFEMAVSELEFALERARELPIRHLSLLQRWKMIKGAYVEAMELLDRCKQQAMSPGQEELPRVVNKRKRWFHCAKKNMLSMAPSFAGLSTDVVGRFEWYADCAGRFVRDLESGCSLHHYTFCNPIVRHLLEGKTLTYHSEQGNLLRHLYIRPMYSDERGVETFVAYRYEDSTVAEKCFFLGLILRLTESTDLVKIAIQGLQLLASQFKLVAEYAIGELTLLSNLQDIAHLHAPLSVGMQEWHIKHSQLSRPDPACCKGSRHGLCANNNASSELADVFPEQIIVLSFQCYISALESKTCSSFNERGRRRRRRSKNRGRKKTPLVLTAAFMPHAVTQTEDSYALEIIGDAKEYRNATSIQQVAETIQSGAVNCFSRQPELAKYEMDWVSKHGFAGFVVEKSRFESAVDLPNLLRRDCCIRDEVLRKKNVPPTATAEKGKPSRASTTGAIACKEKQNEVVLSLSLKESISRLVAMQPSVTSPKCSPDSYGDVSYLVWCSVFGHQYRM